MTKILSTPAQQTRFDEGGPQPVRPVLVWATIGAGFLLMAVYVFTAWFVTGEATPTPTGADPVPTATKIWVRAFEALSVSVALAGIIHAVRSSRRLRGLSFDAMLLIGFATSYWLDPLVNYVRPAFFYNTYFVNLGSWVERIPGWISPNGSRFPEPLLFTFGAYVWMMWVAVLFCWAVRRAARRWPHAGKIKLFLSGFGIIAALDCFLEIMFLRTELIAYPGTIHGLSYAGGHTYQFPLYEPLLAGAVWSAAGALRYWHNDKGQSVVERGVDRVGGSNRVQTALRTLAVVGFVQTCFLLYAIPFTWSALHVDKTPDYPSYLRAGLCGPGTGYPCPDTTHPIPLPLTPPDPSPS